VLNVFRMFGMMKGNRQAVGGDLAYNVTTICDSDVRGNSDDINALASWTVNAVTILVWNYQNKDIQGESSDVDVSVKHPPSQGAVLYHYRIDRRHSNSYEEWERMGSPHHPTREQIRELAKSGRLEMLGTLMRMRAKNQRRRIRMQLPRQAVSLQRVVME
jgi:xylan 1,4-beta-xylosidase